MTTVNEAEVILRRTIEKKIVHKDYDRTLAVSKWANQIMTGKDQDELITQYKARETDELKKQRIKLYSALTPLAAGQIQSVFRKVRRTDGIYKVVDAGEDAKAENLTKALSDFYGRQSLEEYLFDRKEYWTFYDPNAFLVVDFKELEQTVSGNPVKIKTYPVEFSSAEAINFEYWNGDLQWVIFERTRPGVQEGKFYSDWYTYLAGYVIHYRQVDPDDENYFIPDGYERFEINRTDGDTVIIDGRIFENGTTKIAAHRVGEYPDPLTRGRTYITPLHFAEDIFTKLIRDTSYQDLNKTLHTFLQKYVYAPDCEYEHPEYGRCDSGIIHTDEGDKTCPACKGSGLYYHTTEQETVMLKLPEAGESPVPLSSLVYYVDLPQWLPEWLSTEIEKYIRWVYLAVFNSELRDQSEVAKTATEVRVTWDQVYDTLEPYAASYSGLFEFSVQIAGQYEEVRTLQVAHRFPPNFNMEGVSEAVELFKQMKEAGISAVLLEAQEMRIAAKVHRNTPGQVQKIKAWREVMPFRDKTPEERIFILTRRDVSDPDRVIWENFSRIQAEIEEQTQGRFSMMKYIERLRMVREKAQEIAQENNIPDAGGQVAPVDEEQSVVNG